MGTSLSTAESRILEGLNEAQHEAVTHGEGPLLIIAGAGTGKTTVLTRRIAHLIATKRARPEEILALTFTEKAAAEMSERVDQLIPYGYAETSISTFHAFGDRVLRDAALEVGLNPEFRVLSQPEQIIFLRERIFDLPLRRFRPLGDPTRHLKALCTLVSRAKDEDVSPESYLAWAEGRLATAVSDEERDEAERHIELAAFYAAHQRLLGEAGLVDFGDQIHRALGLLRDRPAVLQGLRERYRWILVDEFQDTNHAQLELLKLLSGDPTNLTVVGDDDQAIYRWRGAAAANLLAFRRLYRDCREVVLTRELPLDPGHPRRRRRASSPSTTPTGWRPSPGSTSGSARTAGTGRRSVTSTSTPCRRRPTGWPTPSTAGCRRGPGRGTWRSWSGATTTPTPSSAPSTSRGSRTASAAAEASTPARRSASSSRS